MKFTILKGKIEKSKLLISGKDELNDFLKKNNGRGVFVRIEAYDRESTEAQRGLYWVKIVPEAQRGFSELGEWKTEQDIDILLRSECPFVNDTIENLDKEQMSQFIDWCKFYLAENLHVFIPDWRVL